MNNNRIKIGDEVEVLVSEGVGLFQSCIVQYIPGSPGDSWIFKLPYGDILYVQTFLYIRKKMIINKDK